MPADPLTKPSRRWWGERGDRIARDRGLGPPPDCLGCNIVQHCHMARWSAWRWGRGGPLSTRLLAWPYNPTAPFQSHTCARLRFDATRQQNSGIINGPFLPGRIGLLSLPIAQLLSVVFFFPSSCFFSSSSSLCLPVCRIDSRRPVMHVWTASALASRMGHWLCLSLLNHLGAYGIAMSGAMQWPPMTTVTPSDLTQSLLDGTVGFHSLFSFFLYPQRVYLIFFQDFETSSFSILFCNYEKKKNKRIPPVMRGRTSCRAWRALLCPTAIPP